MDGINKPVRWRLDLEKNVGTPEGATGKLANYVLPLRPMIGSIAVAAPPGDAAPMANDSGFYGGNMDFNLIREAATVYLTIQAPGALLYLGDVHAAQGDGELDGHPEERAREVERKVDVGGVGAGVIGQRRIIAGRGRGGAAAGDEAERRGG